VDKSKTVNGIYVEASEWKKGNQHRIYFSALGGQACWDVNAGEWVKVHKEFGARFKAAVKAAWGL
jgi:hypothetical protein